MDVINTDVIVIGAGPAGSSVAKVIAEEGFGVVLVERDSYPGKNNVCAGGIPRFVIEKMGLEDAVEKEIPADVIYLPWTIKRIKRKNVSVYRYVFDRKLAERAVECGAKLITNTTIHDVILKNDHILAVSNSRIIRGKIVVFADGPNTLAFRKFGIGFKPDANKTIVAVVCEVEDKNNEYYEFELHVDPEIVEWGYGWVFPKRNTVNIGVGCLYSILEDNIMMHLRRFITTYPENKQRFKNKKIVWLRSSIIPACPAEKIYGERMLVVGDAAGMVDPISGGGIAYAIAGGVLAGQTCVEALVNQDFSEHFLIQYQNRWIKTVEYRTIKLRYLLSNIFLYLYKFNKKSYAKLIDISYGKENKLKKLLKIIIH